jgi:RNA polymerase sigma-70 factor (ECF subfamily)
MSFHEPGMVVVAVRRMNTTSASLLEQLRQPDAADAWRRFVHLYTPLLYYWARGTGLPAHDAADLVQEVLVVLVQKLPEFSYDRSKSFRGWLRTVALNKWRERCRRFAARPDQAGDTGLSGVESPDPVVAFEEADYRAQLVRRALQIMQTEFEPSTWKACWEVVVSNRHAAEVAAELGVSVDVVYSAKSRVLRRLRQELDGLLD